MALRALRLCVIIAEPSEENSCNHDARAAALAPPDLARMKSHRYLVLAAALLAAHPGAAGAHPAPAPAVAATASAETQPPRKKRTTARRRATTTRSRGARAAARPAAPTGPLWT